MNSPVYNSPSDLSTPKPIFGRPNEDLTTEDFLRYLQSLHDDINNLGNQVESLRNENIMLKGQINVIKNEKEKHIFSHAKEKHELEKALQIEKSLRKITTKELDELKSKFQNFLSISARTKTENSYNEIPSSKSLRPKKLNHGYNIKSKLWKMEKEHKQMKKKIKEIQSKSMSFKKSEPNFDYLYPHS